MAYEFFKILLELIEKLTQNVYFDTSHLPKITLFRSKSIGLKYFFVAVYVKHVCIIRGVLKRFI